jgi:hypothetical protein
MRHASSFSFSAALCVSLALALPSAAQDTNFSTGPQYLLNGSPLFARPITTPSLSLETPLDQPTDHTGSEALAEQAVENKLEQVPPLDFSSIYYEPSTAEEIVISSNNSEAQGESPQLPASIVASGVTQMIDAQSLHERGYGMSLAEAAAQWKERKSAPVRTYKNEDIERLRQGS